MHKPFDTDSATQIAIEIVEAELIDDWFLADLLRKNLREANKVRRSEGKKSIRATQQWYFQHHSK